MLVVDISSLLAGGNYSTALERPTAAQSIPRVCDKFFCFVRGYFAGFFFSILSFPTSFRLFQIALDIYLSLLWCNPAWCWCVIQCRACGILFWIYRREFWNFRSWQTKYEPVNPHTYITMIANLIVPKRECQNRSRSTVGTRSRLDCRALEHVFMNSREK